MALIYEYLNYSEYLNSWVLDKHKKGRGQKKLMAEYLDCHSTFISQVFNGDTHLALEHGLKLNKFLGHSNEEGDFFLLLIQYARAGSHELKNYFLKKIETIHKERLDIKKRLKATNIIQEKDKIKYYSSWYYSTLWVMLGLPGHQDKEVLAKRLNLSVKKVTEIIEFLLNIGLLYQENDLYKLSKSYIHLGSNEALIQQHHTNWRLKTLDVLSDPKQEDLHFSLVTSLTHQDLARLKAKMVDYIEEIQSITGPSERETLCCINMDLFEL